MAAFRSELLGLFGKSNHLYKTFNWRSEGFTGPVGGIVGLSTNAPTDIQVETALHNWQYYGKNISQLRNLLDGPMKKALGQKVQSGLNDGKGATEDPSRGKIVSGAAQTPWLGTENAMLYELNGKDGEGQRSSMGYGTWTARCLIDVMLALEISGVLDKSDPAIGDMLKRLAKSLDVWRYFSRRGYYSWAHGGLQGGGGGSPAEWPIGGPSNWYVPMNEALWFDALRVKLQLATAVP
jgi:hypothetical protein